MKLLLTGAAVVATAAVAVAILLLVNSNDVPGADRSEFAGQGGGELLLVSRGAELIRSSDGLRGHAVVEAPEPGSYAYPTGDMVAEGAPPHPDVLVGSETEPEVFTMWIFVFNYPEQCTDAKCDVDDLGADTPAAGGIYQLDGRVGGGDEMEFSGRVRLGQPPLRGAALENPLGAEVHLTIAPHGKALEGGDLVRQLNSPVGNPELWWTASF